MQHNRSGSDGHTTGSPLPEDATELLSRPSKDAAGPAETELHEGDLLGAWRLLKPLGHGGMGAVYLAERADGHFEQIAAVKLIRGEADAETFAQFARERQILAALQHPHIARLLDGGATPGGQPYLVMEYVEGEPIDAYCRRHALGLSARLALFQQVCRAVQFAHQRLIVHCDLKPSNVLVRSDGSPVLLDFGIARALDRPRLQEFVGSSYLTPGYASPEQLSGGQVTTESDVFALGLILFELVTGRRARQDNDDRTVSELRTAAVQPSRLAADVPWKGRLRGDLDAIVLRATVLDPAARYASAEDLARDIQRHLDHWPVHARGRQPSYVLGRLLRRRWPVFAAGLLVAALVAGFTWRLVAARDRAQAAERDARVQATTAQKVSDFLVSVFEVSNPRLNKNREISARAVLDEGARRITDELADEPRTKARLLQTLATAYRYIGEPAQSAELFRQAIALYLDPRVDEPLAAAAASSQLAVVYSNDLPGTDAVAEARHSLALRARYAPHDKLGLADALNTLGITLEGKDEFDAAEQALRKSLELRREMHAPPSMIASSLHNLGLVFSNRGAPRGALPYYEEALKLRADSDGEHSAAYQTTLQVYGVALTRAGDYEKGVPVLERNLAVCLDLYGKDSANTATAHNELGFAVHDLGRFREAAAHYSEDLRIETETIGEDRALIPLNNLASAYEDMEDYAKALPLFERSLTLRQKALPADDARVLRAQSNLARILIELGQYARAKPLVDAAWAGFQKRFGDDNVNTVKTGYVLASWQAGMQRFDELSTLLDRLRAAKIRFTPQMKARQHELDAELAAARHDAPGVVAARKAAWQAMHDAFGDRHPLTAKFALAYADALATQGHRDQAKPFVAPYIPVIDAAFIDDAPVRKAATRWH